MNATAIPTSPVATPIRTSSASTAAKTLVGDHPRVKSVPISARRERTEASAALTRNNEQETSTSTNSRRLFWLTAFRYLTATPLATQPSLTSNGGWPNLPLGSSMSIGVGDEPAVMSTLRPVCSWILSATALMRARLAGSGPLTPATLTRMTLMGRSGSAPSKMLGSANELRALSVVSIRGGWPM